MKGPSHSPAMIARIVSLTRFQGVLALGREEDAMSSPSRRMLNRDQPALPERAAAILRNEIANGALANIAAVNRVWSAHSDDLIAPEAAGRLVAGVGGLLNTVL